MTDHAFAIGDQVLIIPDTAREEEFGGTYEVTAHLPTDGPVPRYRLKSIAEAFSRVIGENALLALFGPNRPPVAIKSKIAIRMHNEPVAVTLATTSATRMSLGVH